MKSLTCLLMTLFTLQVIAGDKDFSKSMIPLIENGKVFTESESFQKLAEDFAALAKQYPNEWLPLYYAAYHYTNAAAKSDDGAAKVKFYEQAEDFIAKGLNEAPEESELYALRAYVINNKQKTTEKINNNEWLVRFNMAINNAKKYGPGNPRAYLVSAMHLIYQPDKMAEAKVDADRAFILYEKEVKSLYPDWGKNLATSLSKKLQSN